MQLVWSGHFVRTRLAAGLRETRQVDTASAMAPENVEIVKGQMEADERGDSDTAMEAFDPAVELDQTRFPDGGSRQVLAGPHRGGDTDP